MFNRFNYIDTKMKPLLVPPILEDSRSRILDESQVQYFGNLGLGYWKSFWYVELANLAVLGAVRQDLHNNICLIRIFLFKKEKGGENHFVINAPDSNIAERPYCIPLIAETLGKVNYEVNFTVDLRPDLPAGTYTVISDIEIDPNQVWIKHSQKQLGKINVLEDNDKAFVLLTMEEIPEQITKVITETIEKQRN